MGTFNVRLTSLCMALRATAVMCVAAGKCAQNMDSRRRMAISNTLGLSAAHCIVSGGMPPQIKKCACSEPRPCASSTANADVTVPNTELCSRSSLHSGSVTFVRCSGLMPSKSVNTLISMSLKTCAACTGLSATSFCSAGFVMGMSRCRATPLPF